MIEKIVIQLNRYKQKYLQQIENLTDTCSDITSNIFYSSKKRIKLEKIKIQLKKKYFDLGLYVAKQYVKHGYSDFTLDKHFIDLNESIKKKILEYQESKDSIST